MCAAILGPRGLPREIVTRWNTEIDRILQLPEAQKRMTNDGLEPAGGAPERFAGVLQRDIAKWRQVVAAAGIKPGP